ncbi:siderophore-interacting protein [Arthrobacter echini]|uniref:Siderophore-interacting protein n=1 Tax=Arthrobacter echini TaxID=1529066 RepID=A0A4S5E062_9MICC|nr:siderophore-interacting protein [Arthrobacter echini]THJ64632.1 siderophore-interacting protein [Arthrobacter echini]
MGHGWEHTVLKVLGARDFRLSLLNRVEITPSYLRLTFADGGLLSAATIHPTMWIRLWFEHDGKPHQRAFTLVAPDSAAGTFDVDFALHPGAAADWSRDAPLGAPLDATLQGSKFAIPSPTPTRLAVVGDAASAPAINSLLDAMPDTPATIWFGHNAPEDHAIPLHSRPADDLRRIECMRGPDALVDAVTSELVGRPVAAMPDMVWVAIETSATRRLTKKLREDLGVPKRSLHALGYWRAA